MMSTSVATIYYILHTTERKKKKKKEAFTSQKTVRSCQDPLSGALLYVTPRKTEKGMSQAEL